MLTDSKDYLTARKYWNKLKQRLKEEGNETVTNCNALKMKAADGKMRLTDVADREQMFRLIRSIPVDHWVGSSLKGGDKLSPPSVQTAGGKIPNVNLGA